MLYYILATPKRCMQTTKFKSSHPSTGLQKIYHVTYFNHVENLKRKNLWKGEQTIDQWEFWPPKIKTNFTCNI